MDLELVKEIPAGINPRQIDGIVWNLTNEIDTHGDKTGFFNQTIKMIADATFLKKGGDFWLVHDGVSVGGYALGSICEDIDGRLTYHLTQAWVDKQFRRTKIVKEWLGKIRQRARQCLCTHFLIVSARKPDVFCRWLGNTKIYATLLLENLKEG